MTHPTELRDMMVRFAEKPQLPEQSRSSTTEIEQILLSAHQQIIPSLGLDKVERYGQNTLRAVIRRALESYDNTYRAFGLLVASEAEEIKDHQFSDVSLLKRLAESRYAQENFIQDELYKAFYFAGLIFLSGCHSILIKDQTTHSYSQALEHMVLGMDAIGHGMKFETLAQQKSSRKKGGDSKAKKYFYLEDWIQKQAPTCWQEDTKKEYRISDIAIKLHDAALDNPTKFKLAGVMDIPEPSFFKKRIRKHHDYPAYLSARGPRKTS